MIIRANRVNTLPRYRGLSQAQIDAEAIRHPRVTIIRRGKKIRLPVDAAGLIFAGRSLLGSGGVILPPPDPREVDSTTALLAVFTPQLIRTPTANSYSLKHLYERFLKLRYCSNGAAIVAMHQEGIEQHWDDSLNTMCAISKLWLRSMEKMIRTMGDEVKIF